MIKRVGRRAATVGGVIALTLAGPVVTELLASAHADVAAPLVWCDAGYYLRDYSPSLTDTAHDFAETLTGELADCSSPAATGDPTVDGIATLRGSGTGTGSCTNDGTMNETLVLGWPNGRTSTISVSTAIVIKANEPLILSTGTVTAGEFLGAKVLVIPQAVNDDVACGTPQGMTAAVGRIPTVVFL